jgi:hypothetical protein
VLSSSDIGVSCVKRYTNVKQPISEGTWNPFHMLEPTVSPVSRFARNLKKLIKMQAVQVTTVAEGARVTPKQVYNLMAAGHDFRLKSTEKVANFFGLTTWQMLAVDLEDSPALNKQVLTLLELYSRADEAGRSAIMQVAEIAAGRASR